MQLPGLRQRVTQGGQIARPAAVQREAGEGAVEVGDLAQVLARGTQQLRLVGEMRYGVLPAADFRGIGGWSPGYQSAGP
jgi:hypothetical protein